jgi:hypothetical protein
LSDPVDAASGAYTQLVEIHSSGIIIAREDEPVLPPRQTWEEAAGAIDWY